MLFLILAGPSVSPWCVKLVSMYPLYKPHGLIFADWGAQPQCKHLHFATSIYLYYWTISGLPVGSEGQILQSHHFDFTNIKSLWSISKHPSCWHYQVRTEISLNMCMHLNDLKQSKSSLVLISMQICYFHWLIPMP